MSVETVLELKKGSHPRRSRHAERLFGMMWSVRLIVVLQHFAFSVLLFLIVLSPLSLSISLIAVYLPYLAYGLLLPSALFCLPLHSPHVVALLRSAGSGSSFMDVGVPVVEIFGEIVGSWLAAEEEEKLAGWPVILRAELSSNPGRRRARTNPPS